MSARPGRVKGVFDILCSASRAGAEAGRVSGTEDRYEDRREAGNHKDGVEEEDKKGETGHTVCGRRKCLQARRPPALCQEGRPSDIKKYREATTSEAQGGGPSSAKEFLFVMDPPPVRSGIASRHSLDVAA